MAAYHIDNFREKNKMTWMNTYIDRTESRRRRLEKIHGFNEMNLSHLRPGSNALPTELMTKLQEGFLEYIFFAVLKHVI